MTLTPESRASFGDQSHRILKAALHMLQELEDQDMISDQTRNSMCGLVAQYFVLSQDEVVIDSDSLSAEDRYALTIMMQWACIDTLTQQIDELSAELMPGPPDGVWN